MLIPGIIAANRRRGNNYRYWRIHGTTRISGSHNVQYDEVFFYDAELNDLAIISGGTPDAETEFSGAFLVENAFDRNATERWAASGGTRQWLSFDFLEPVAVTRVDLKAHSSFNEQRWFHLFIERSKDGIVWETVHYEDSIADPGPSGTTVITLTDNAIVKKPGNTPHRYWRLHLYPGDVHVTGGTGSFYGLESLDLYGDDGPPAADLTTTFGGTASASSVQTGFDAAHAFDDDTETDWVTNSVVPPDVWLQWDFGEGNEQVVKSFGFKTRDAVIGIWTNFSLQYSDDGVNWFNAYIRVVETGDPTYNNGASFFTEI